MRRFTERAITVTLALAVGAAIGAVAMKMISAHPKISISEPKESSNFAVQIPSEQQPAIEEVAKSIREVDLPGLLRAKHPDIAETWRNGPFHHLYVVNPFGKNIVNVTVMLPHYAFSDPQDRAQVKLVESLNRELDATILEILESRARKQ